MATRRSHTKSRNGCDQCKRRRVKCDEKTPCSNCSRRRMACSYDNRGSPGPSGPNSTGILSDIRSHMLANGSPQQGLPDDPFSAFQSRLSYGTFFPQEWTPQDPELMHHYTLHTSRTIARRPEMQETWQVAIPQIAYSTEFLMHGILALSALHSAYLKPQRLSHYLALSGFHMSLGLRSFRRTLLSPSSENCHALFCFSGLVMVYIHASTTKSIHGEVVSPQGLDSVFELLGLCRGTLVLRPYMEQVRSSNLRPLFLNEFYTGELEENASKDPLFDPLINLTHLITSELPPTERPTFEHALSRLRQTYRTIENAATLESGLLYVWPIALEEECFNHMKAGHPVALILLAYWCVLIPRFSDFWFIGDCGRDWFGRVEDMIPERLMGWLVWPREIVEGGTPAGPGSGL
ncbi:Zn(II)2Cys6 transcription factor [Aspergillus stella-maris]|uniref:Zn(II)2Cys6 transcription factor n=1 Tax=Aspergillus stella-maris TaxID=1810926 RepID=UPI003CCE35E9